MQNNQSPVRSQFPVRLAAKIQWIRIRVTFYLKLLSRNLREYGGKIQDRPFASGAELAGARWEEYIIGQGKNGPTIHDSHRKATSLSQTLQGFQEFAKSLQSLIGHGLPRSQFIQSLLHFLQGSLQHLKM